MALDVDSCECVRLTAVAGRYNVNSVESHVAIEIVSKVVRLMATDDEVEKIAAEGLVSINGDDGGVSNFAGSYNRSSFVQPLSVGSAGCVETSKCWTILHTHAQAMTTSKTNLKSRMEEVGSAHHRSEETSTGTGRAAAWLSNKLAGAVAVVVDGCWRVAEAFHTLAIPIAIARVAATKQRDSSRRCSSLMTACMN